MINKNAVLLAILMTASQTVCWAREADNTRINQRDNNPEAMTADKQGQTKSDLEITQEIRKAIIADESLTVYAHNVKIITTDGVVTLKGPVTSIEERQRVADIASNIAGMDRIHDEMDIVTK